MSDQPKTNGNGRTWLSKWPTLLHIAVVVAIATLSAWIAMGARISDSDPETAPVSTR